MRVETEIAVDHEEGWAVRLLDVATWRIVGDVSLVGDEYAVTIESVDEWTPGRRGCWSKWHGAKSRWFSPGDAARVEEALIEEFERLEKLGKTEAA